MQACEGANRTDGARVSVLKNTARLSKCRSIVKAEYFNKWIYKFSLITPNGPAVCFSRRNPTTAPGRVQVPRVSGADKLSRCKEGLARVFAVQVQKFVEHYACRGTSFIGAGNYPRLQSWLVALAQCRGTNCLGGRKWSRCRIYIGCRCACPGARTITNLSKGQEQSKNRDKPIKHTVRVSISGQN